MQIGNNKITLKESGAKFVPSTYVVIHGILIIIDCIAEKQNTPTINNTEIMNRTDKHDLCDTVHEMSSGKILSI